MNGIIKVNGYMKKVEEFIITASILLMAVILVANVIGRTLHHTLTFAEELSVLLSVICTFVGTSYCARLGCHITMTAAVDTLPHAGKKICMYIVSIGTAAAMLFLAYWAGVYVLSLYTSGRFSPSLHIPLWIPYLLIPFGLIMTAIQYLIILYLNIRDRDVVHTGIEQLVDETVDMSDEAIAQAAQEAAAEDASPEKNDEKKEGEDV